jgi:hypothetical protein
MWIFYSGLTFASGSNAIDWNPACSSRDEPVHKSHVGADSIQFFVHLFVNTLFHKYKSQAGHADNRVVVWTSDPIL